MKKTSLILALALMLLLSACSAPSAPSPTPTDAPNDPSVSVDWDALTPRETPLPDAGARYYSEYTSDLIVSDDYGELVPFAGLRLDSGWSSETGCLFGLMTTRGEVVCDSVFSEVYKPYISGGRADAYVLRAGERCGLAATDGSWYTGTVFKAVSCDASGALFYDEDGFSWLGYDGRTLARYRASELGLSQDEYAASLGEELWYSLQLVNGHILLSSQGEGNAIVATLFDLSSGQLVTMSDEELNSLFSAGMPEYDPSVEHRFGELLYYSDDANGSVERSVWLGDRRLLPELEITYIEELSDGAVSAESPGILAVSYREGDEYPTRYLRSDGEELTLLDGWSTYGSMLNNYRFTLCGGVLGLIGEHYSEYYDLATLEPVFRTSLHYYGD